MKNLLLPIVAVFFSITIYGQMGVNTTSPKSTFEINAKNEKGTSTLTDGLLIPRVDRQRALSMASVEPSTLIYVNNIATGTATGQASNIDALGFYYFDGLSGKWSKLTTGSFSGDPTKDAFVDDAANAMVKLGETTSGTVRVAGSEFVIKDNGAVGIGTASPTQKLDVVGKGQFSEKVTIGSNWTGAALSVDNAISSEPILTLSDTNSVRKVTVNNNGNVGIGTDSPTQKLDVVGNGRFSEKVTIGSNWTGAALSVNNAVSSEPILALSSTNSERKVTVDNNGNVGVGTNTPSEKLDVDGNARIRQVPTVSKLGDKDVLLTDGNGNLSKISSENLEIKGTLINYVKNDINGKDVALGNTSNVNWIEVKVPAGEKHLIEISTNVQIELNNASNISKDFSGYGDFFLKSDNTLLYRIRARFVTAGGLKNISIPNSYSEFVIINNISGTSQKTVRFNLEYKAINTSNNINNLHQVLASFMSLKQFKL